MRTTIGRGVLPAVLAGLIFLLLFFAVVSCRSGGIAGGEEESVKVYTGRIKSGFMGAGGEHTGWMLLRGGKQPDLEADVSAVMARAKELDGTKVKASGSFYEKAYVERGTVRILKIETLSPAPR
jgi:hypothetical protein